MNREELIRYARDVCSAEPEYLWRDTPEAFVLRHAHNRRWFAVVMSVERRKLGLDGDGKTDLLDVKCGPLLGGSFIGTPGVVPAWHMNKSHWIGVLLDGTASDETVRQLLDISWELTRKRS
jgi:predicted DNA-binding protein (MmcQ/YjbR family)